MFTELFIDAGCWPGRLPRMSENLFACPHSAAAERPPTPPRRSHELIRATKPFAHDDTLKSWWYILSTLFLLLAAMGGALWHFHPVIRAVSSVFAGLLVTRFFV